MKTRIAWSSLRNAGAAALVLALVSGCATSTKLVHSWITPEFQPGSVKKVLVVGVAQDQGRRHVYEDSFAADIKQRGLEAGPSYRLFIDLGKVDKEQAAAELRKDQYTHVLVTRVVSIEDRETYHPPSTVSVGVGYAGYPGYYGSWYPYMSLSYGYVTSPGYTTVKRVVGLETNVYDLSTEKMIYSGMTETWVDDSPGKRIPEIISRVAWDLKAKKIL